MPVDLFNAPKPLSFVLKGSHDRYSSTNSILGNHRIPSHLRRTSGEGVNDCDYPPVL